MIKRDNNSFYINRTENKGGPSIFGYRLKNAILNQGFKWNRYFPAFSFNFSAGYNFLAHKNILRLDGIYFDSENTLGDSDKKNKPMFKAYKRADGVIFQSEFSRCQFSNAAGESESPSIVIPNGVPEKFFGFKNKFDYGFSKTLITSAKWGPYKRLDSVIEGFLSFGDPKVGLVIIGDGVDFYVEHPNIKYIGKVAPELLPFYLNGGDAFIFLSWIDNCPNTVVEALACGLPVLCTHNGGTKEIVKDNGIVLTCEEDYHFEKVPVFRPPKCPAMIVAKGIEQILKWDKKVQSDHLRIENIPCKFNVFISNILNPQMV